MHFLSISSAYVQTLQRSASEMLFPKAAQTQCRLQDGAVTLVPQEKAPSHEEKSCCCSSEGDNWLTVMSLAETEGTVIWGVDFWVPFLASTWYFCLSFLLTTTKWTSKIIWTEWQQNKPKLVTAYSLPRAALNWCLMWWWQTNPYSHSKFCLLNK